MKKIFGEPENAFDRTVMIELIYTIYFFDIEVPVYKRCSRMFLNFQGLKIINFFIDPAMERRYMLCGV